MLLITLFWIGSVKEVNKLEIDRHKTENNNDNNNNKKYINILNYYFKKIYI